MFPQVNRTILKQEQTVLGGETIIVGPDGSLKLSRKSRIIPVGYDKKPLSKRLVYTYIVNMLLYIPLSNSLNCLLQCHNSLYPNLFRENKTYYRDERRRQRNWVPTDMGGNIEDIIMDPHIQRGISVQECQLCNVIFKRDANLSVDQDRLHNLREEQARLMGASCSAPSNLSLTTLTDATIEEMPNDQQQ